MELGHGWRWECIACEVRWCSRVLEACWCCLDTAHVDHARNRSATTSPPSPYLQYLQRAT